MPPPASLQGSQLDSWGSLTSPFPAAPLPAPLWLPVALPSLQTRPHPLLPPSTPFQCQSAIRGRPRHLLATPHFCCLLPLPSSLHTLAPADPSVPHRSPHCILLGPAPAQPPLYAPEAGDPPTPRCSQHSRGVGSKAGPPVMPSVMPPSLRNASHSCWADGQLS